VRERQKKTLDLLQSCGTPLYAMLTRLTLSENDAGDLMQELFIRLSQSKGLDKAKDPIAYARRAAVNLAFEWRRKRKARFEPLGHHCMPAQNQPSALGTVIQKEQLEQVLDAAAKLKGLAREVIVMHYIERQSYEQIAGRLGKNPAHIRSVSAKALARIRVLLRGQLRRQDAEE